MPAMINLAGGTVNGDITKVKHYVYPTMVITLIEANLLEQTQVWTELHA